MSLMMGFADSPLCGPCLAGGVELALPELVQRLLESVRRKGCLAAGWIAADAAGSCDRIAPHVSRPVEMPEEDEHADEPVVAGAPPRTREPAHDELYDAGPLSCGDLVLLLRKKLLAMAPGRILKVRATDPSAPQDLPAWCRLTRHPLVSQQHPWYWIRRRPDDAGG